MIRQKKGIRGLTLVEMLLYVGICSLFLLSLSVFFSTLLSVKVKTRVIAEVNQQGLQITQLLGSVARDARYVATPSSKNASSTLIVGLTTTPASTSTFFISNGALYLQEGTGTPLVLTNERVTVQNLLFTNTSASSTDGGSVTASFTLIYKNLSGKRDYDFSNSFTTLISFH